MRHPNLILGRSLDFSIGAAKSWGVPAILDLMIYYFINNLEAGSLIDTPLVKLKPTWRNKRTGGDRVMKRLDHFLSTKGLIKINTMLR